MKENAAAAAGSPAADGSASQSDASEIITIAGGVEMEVTHADGSKERVKVRQIPISKIQQFVVALSDEASAIELYCDKPLPKEPNQPRWADTLTFESAAAILDEGLKLNSFFLEGWFRRQAKWRELQAQGAIAELEKKIESMIAASRSASSQPQSPITTD
jgi:hypothetical protein